MKRFFFLLLSPLLLISCATATNPSSASTAAEVIETDKTKRYDIDLNTSNYWKYLDLSIAKTSQNVYYGLQLDIDGVLTFAYYEDVVMTFDYVATGTGGVGGTMATYTGTVSVALNAAGSYHQTYSYEFIPENVSPTFQGSSFYGYERSMTLKSIKGMVHFAI